MNAPGPLLVACLCAGWCNACRDYRPRFDALAAQFPGQAEFAWIDIEDDADRLGELEVDNFPTLLLAVGERLAFLGPVTPLTSTAARLVRSALAGVHDPEAGASAPADLVVRVRAVVQAKHAAALKDPDAPHPQDPGAP